MQAAQCARPVQLSARLATLEQVAAWVRSLGKDASPAEKRLILQMLGVQVTVFDEGRIEISSAVPSDGLAASLESGVPCDGAGRNRTQVRS